MINGRKTYKVKKRTCQQRVTPVPLRSGDCEAVETVGRKFERVGKSR